MTGAMAASEFRAHFPALADRVHLSSCSLGARSIELDAALRRMLDDMATPDAWSRFEEQVDQARRGFAALIGATADQVALVPNASIGAYQVASTVDWGKRSGVLTTADEFPSLAQVWLAQRGRGAEVVRVRDIDACVDRLDGLGGPRIRLVSIPLISYQYGHQWPVAEVARAAHEHGAQVFVDAYQAVGVRPVDVAELDCDFLVAGSMKYLLGLPGVAFLYVRAPELLDRNPELTGWFGRVNPFAFDPTALDYPCAATKFHTGTQAVPECYAANAGIQLIDSVDLAAVRSHVAGLTEHAVERLEEQGEQVRAPLAEQRGAHIGIVDPDPPVVARFLADHNVSVSPRGDVVRVSFHYYNDIVDIDELCGMVGVYRRAGTNTRSLVDR